MTRCRLCHAPIRYAAEDRRRRFPLDADGAGHVCYGHIYRWPEDFIPWGAPMLPLPRIRRKEEV